MWLYQFIMRPPHGCYEWSCFCSAQEFIRHLHLLILRRLFIKPVQENVEAFYLPVNPQRKRGGIDFFDPFQEVPIEARQDVIDELVRGMLALQPVHAQLDPDLDKEPLKVFRRLVSVVCDFTGGGYEKTRVLFKEGWVKDYLAEMHEHHEEGKRRQQRHLFHQDELSRAGRERRARDLVIKAKREEYRSALKLVRDRERAIFAGR